MLTPPEGWGPQARPCLCFFTVSFFLVPVQLFPTWTCMLVLTVVSRFCFPFLQEGSWFIQSQRSSPSDWVLGCQCSKRLHGCILQVSHWFTSLSKNSTASKTLQHNGFEPLPPLPNKDFIKVLWWCEVHSSGIGVVSNDHPWSPSDLVGRVAQMMVDLDSRSHHCLTARGCRFKANLQDQYIYRT